MPKTVMKKLIGLPYLITLLNIRLQTTEISMLKTQSKHNQVTIILPVQTKNYAFSDNRNVVHV